MNSSGTVTNKGGSWRVRANTRQRPPNTLTGDENGASTLTKLTEPGTPHSICRIKSGKVGRFLVAFHASDPIPHTLPLLAQTQGMNRSEQAHGILEEHVRQLFDTGNELFDNSNEPYARLERFHGLVHGEPRELLA